MYMIKDKLLQPDAHQTIFSRNIIVTCFLLKFIQIKIKIMFLFRVSS